MSQIDLSNKELWLALAVIVLLSFTAYYWYQNLIVIEQKNILLRELIETCTLEDVQRIFQVCESQQSHALGIG